MTESVLDLRGFGIGYGERIILSEIDLAIEDRGIHVLLGPCGTGKSTLLRTLAGFNSPNPSLRTWGEAHYLGAPLFGGELFAGELPALVAQSARLMMASILENIVSGLPERNQLTKVQQRDLAVRLLGQAGLSELVDQLDSPVIALPLALQRHLAILREVSANPRLLLVDEPTAGLSEPESFRLLDYIREQSEHRAVLIVLHNQQQARFVGGTAILLAGGRVQEQQPIPDLFDLPVSAAGSEFARVGTCSLPSPDADPETLDAETPPPLPLPKAATKYVSQAFGPRGFLWVKKGFLAGTPLPGVFFDLDYDMTALQRVGIKVLISLTETPLDPDSLAPYGVRALWQPIPDMGAPSVQQCLEICEQIHRCITHSEPVAVHCRAGLGRTGTILAAYLIWEGAGTLEALDYVRKIEPRWVQSAEQVTFLEEFAATFANQAEEL